MDSNRCLQQSSFLIARLCHVGVLADMPYHHSARIRLGFGVRQLGILYADWTVLQTVWVVGVLNERHGVLSETGM
jgi:hypothetical protein